MVVGCSEQEHVPSAEFLDVLYILGFHDIISCVYQVRNLPVFRWFGLPSIVLSTGRSKE